MTFEAIPVEKNVARIANAVHCHSRYECWACSASSQQKIKWSVLEKSQFFERPEKSDRNSTQSILCQQYIYIVTSKEMPEKSKEMPEKNQRIARKFQ